MNKIPIFIAIVLWTLIAFILVTATIYIANGGLKQIQINNELIKNEKVSIGKAQIIDIDATTQALEIRKTNDSMIRVSQYGNPKTKSEDMFQVTVSDESVHIYINKKPVIFKFLDFQNIREKLVIEIPEDYYGDLDASVSSGGVKIEDGFSLKNVQLTCSSGSIKINESINADSIHAEASSGSIKFDGVVTANEVYAKTTSGSISSDESMNIDGKTELVCSSGAIRLSDDITANAMNVYTGSGGIRLSNVYVEKFDIECSSGSINIESISGGGSVAATSGSIRILLHDLKEDVRLNVTSGSINVTLESSLEFTLMAQTGSGNIRTNFPVNINSSNNSATAEIGENPSVNITANATSGSIRIEN